MASVGMLHHARKKMFLNGNAITVELPVIYSSVNLTTVRDTSLPGIQTYFIYSSRIRGKLSLISINKFDLNIRHRLSVSRHRFPGKTKAFKANLAYVLQDLRLRA